VSARPALVSSHGLARAPARNARTQPVRRTNETSTERAGRRAGPPAATEGR
jgi:hypothetical protein